jgi:hypothetical protein
VAAQDVTQAAPLNQGDLQLPPSNLAAVAADVQPALPQGALLLQQLQRQAG